MQVGKYHLQHGYDLFMPLNAPHIGGLSLHLLLSAAAYSPASGYPLDAFEHVYICRYANDSGLNALSLAIHPEAAFAFENAG
jgi:hypothetical protein